MSTDATSTEPLTTASPTYSVYLGGHLRSAGRFAGPGLTKAEAKKAARNASRLYGCPVSIDRDEACSEALTEAMVRGLRAEAGSAGDAETVELCDGLLDGEYWLRSAVAEIINDARGMDDSRPFVRVVP